MQLTDTVVLIGLRMLAVSGGTTVVASATTAPTAGAVQAPADSPAVDGPCEVSIGDGRDESPRVDDSTP